MDVKYVRSASLPADAMNLIDKDLNSNKMEVNDCAPLKEVSEVEISNAVGKVNDWMNKNVNVPKSEAPIAKMKPIPHGKVVPSGIKLVEYIKTTSGSHHIQTTLPTSEIQFSR